MHGVQGCAALSLSPSSYHVISRVEQLIDFYRPACDAADTVPVYYYHIPELNGCSVDSADFLQLGQRELLQIASIKFTDAT